MLAPVTGNIETYAAHRVSTVELTGAPRAVHAKIVAALEVKRDQPLDTRAVRRDLLLLAKLEIADDVTIAAFPDGERVSLRYQLAPRGLPSGSRSMASSIARCVSFAGSPGAR